MAILSTGDELLELGEALSAGKVINSNAYSLAASIKELGAIPVFLGIARDNRESHREKMTEGLRADAMITSAGVSTGDRDLGARCYRILVPRSSSGRWTSNPAAPWRFSSRTASRCSACPGTQ